MDALIPAKGSTSNHSLTLFGIQFLASSIASLLLSPSLSVLFPRKTLDSFPSALAINLVHFVSCSCMYLLLVPAPPSDYWTEELSKMCKAFWNAILLQTEVWNVSPTSSVPLTLPYKISVYIFPRHYKFQEQLASVTWILIFVIE